MRLLINVLTLIICLGLMGCSNSKNLKITEENKDTFMDEIKNSKDLTVEEVTLLNAYMFRYDMNKNVFKVLNKGKNPVPLVGKTVGEIIELQRQVNKASEEQIRRRQLQLGQRDKSSELKL